MGLLEIIFGKKPKDKTKSKAIVLKYPLIHLGEYVNKTIGVHYISQDLPRIETAVLMFPPTENSFYIGRDGGYHIIHWDSIDHNGKRDAVALIKDTDGNEIYRNNDVHFDPTQMKEKVKNGK